MEENLESIEGYVDHIIYRNADNGRNRSAFETTCKENKELVLADKRRTYFVNIKGNREGISEDTTKLLDYFKTGQPTDSYTESIQNEVELIRDDNDKCIKFSMKT
mgnify:CR=1 FL=1